jgi:nucleotide-binding universal stress UspA family protein
VSGASPSPYRRVLVGTDGSPSAAIAVRHAARLALISGGELTIVSAYTRSAVTVSPMVSNEDAWMVTDAAGAQDHVVGGQDLARAEGLAAVHCRTDAGDPAAVLLDVASEIGADVIVVGSRGMAAASRFLLGSVPNRISHHAGCDVVIVRTVT